MTDKQKNYIRAKAIEQKNKERILEICPFAAENSGIYIFVRKENMVEIYRSGSKRLTTKLPWGVQQ